MMRICSSLLLALVLALTSQSMAVARGASAATGQMVLCTGAGPIAVYVDAEGQPTSAPHICPDSTLNVLFEVTRSDLNAPVRLVSFDLTCLVAMPAIKATTIYGPPSTGPPASV